LQALRIALDALFSAVIKGEIDSIGLEKVASDFFDTLRAVRNMEEGLRDAEGRLGRALAKLEYYSKGSFPQLAFAPYSFSREIAARGLGCKPGEVEEPIRLQVLGVLQELEDECGLEPPLQDAVEKYERYQEHYANWTGGASE